jgi:hypothetical protein
MTTEANGQGPSSESFEIIISGVVSDALKELQRRASEAGMGKLYLAALRRIVHKLQTEARHFGEPLYRLPVSKFVVRLAIVSPLVVNYAVH